MIENNSNDTMYLCSEMLKRDMSKIMEENEPVIQGCTNDLCYCNGECKRIIGYRKKNANPIHPTIEEARQ
jgi:hypothetical protein